jgi:hypothetical protein
VTFQSQIVETEDCDLVVCVFRRRLAADRQAPRNSPRLWRSSSHGVSVRPQLAS